MKKQVILPIETKIHTAFFMRNHFSFLVNEQNCSVAKYLCYVGSS